MNNNLDYLLWEFRKGQQCYYPRLHVDPLVCEYDTYKISESTKIDDETIHVVFENGNYVDMNFNLLKQYGFHNNKGKLMFKEESDCKGYCADFLDHIIPIKEKELEKLRRKRDKLYR